MIVRKIFKKRLKRQRSLRKIEQFKESKVIESLNLSPMLEKKNKLFLKRSLSPTFILSPKFSKNSLSIEKKNYKK